MRPRPIVPLSAEDKLVHAKWSRRVLGVWVMIVAATLLLPIFRSDSASVPRGQALDRAARMR
jgi:hypothetical protein